MRALGRTDRPRSGGSSRRLAFARGFNGAVAIVVLASSGIATAGVAYGQSATESDSEIAVLKRQLLLMQQKLDKLEKQTATNAVGLAQANAKAGTKLAVAEAKAAYPIKGRAALSD